MYSVAIYGQLTGEFVQCYTAINGDGDYGLIEVLRILLTHNYYSSHFYYHVEYEHESWVFTQDTLLGRVCEIYNDITEILGACSNYVKD